MRLSLSHFALIVVSLLLAIIGWELCFEDTFFGGWLPFLAVTLGPLFGFLCGVAARAPATHTRARLPGAAPG